ncbi:50S ribosomal protein L11 methyltransferase [Daejeonella lutea]|uniref:Ribosomal protein L11 methyltransferase n=1 Tax=Daejeonella lutea TaxID=572036 RepID=A0A1T5B7F0_9SPHI|nr:50S ribosomal protein L11 methyltransferase [Daejeonella lutea]SKB43201.1 ribosomal protein L11 methyltransferase [Daejeonella lutea]
MNYIEYTFILSGNEYFHQDLLINSLAEIGFDTFEDMKSGFKAYISDREGITELIDQIGKEYSNMFTFTFETKSIPHQNWNEVWESNFEPLRINDRCYIRATFHQPHPEFEFEIIVDPKMAFGTGHHQTTALMMELMMETDFTDKEVLDMGCGTGILAILASKMGASQIVAIDCDHICFESTIENSLLNNVANIKTLCGSKEAIPEQKFDIILANINRNILLDQIDRYAEVLQPGGLIFFSGFYEEPDLQLIKEKSNVHGLSYISHKVNAQWVAAQFQSKG